MKKIVKGNDFTLRIPVRKIVEGEAVPFPLPACTDIVVNLVNAYRRTALPYSISAEDDSVLEARVESAAFALGAYAVEVRGKMLGAAWRSNEYEQLVLVDNNAAADTPLDGTDEGEGSVEMDTAIAIMPPTAELSQLIDEAHAAVTLAGQTADTLAATDKAAKEAESLRATAEQGRVSAENLRVEAEKKRVEEADKAVAKVEQVVEAAKENVVYIQTGRFESAVFVDEKKVKIPAKVLFRIKGFTKFFFSYKGDLLLFFADYDEPYTMDMASMFEQCSSLVSLNISKWNVGNVTDMQHMFHNCCSLTYLDISKWNVGNVKNMSCMFYLCEALAFLDLSKWDVGNVTDMSWMFRNCNSLTSLDLLKWDTSKVENMEDMFLYCSALSSLTLGEGFGKMKDKVGTLDLSDLSAWTNNTVQSLLTLYDRKANGMGVITIMLHSNTKEALGEDGIAQLTAKGYTIA